MVERASPPRPACRSRALVVTLCRPTHYAPLLGDAPDLLALLGADSERVFRKPMRRD